MSVELYIDFNKVEFKRWLFPGGEVGVEIAPEYGATFANITLTGIPSSEDVMTMFNLLDALEKSGWDKDYVSLTFMYLPYARQDRVCKAGESFALEVFVKLLAAQKNFTYVTCYDVHSNVFFDLMTKHLPEVEVFHFEQHDLCNIPFQFGIIAPDAGAYGKALKIQPHTQHFQLYKTRIDGKVAYEDYPEDRISGTVAVVDDICDGGATFISLGQMLRRTQPGITKLSLYVTHGLFSKGLDALSEIYDNIYCYNLMNESVRNHPKLSVTEFATD